ncbi:hypothetical protein JCM5353_001156 [Sporobolomyces roseus]
MSTRSSLEPPPKSTSSSSRLSKEDRSVKERVDILITRLDRTKDILLHECSKGDRFGNLALGTLEKTLKDLVPAIKLIEQSSNIKEEIRQPDVDTRSKDQAGSSQDQQEEEEELVLSRDHRKRMNAITERDDTSSRRSRGSSAFQTVVTGDSARDPSPPPSRSRSSTTKYDDPLPSKHDSFSDMEDAPNNRIQSRQSSSSHRQSDAALPPSSRPLPVSRPASRLSEDPNNRRKEEDVPSTRNTITKFLNRAKDVVSPSINLKKEPQLSDTDTPLSPPPHSSLSNSTKPDSKSHRRQTSIASDSSSTAPAPKSSSTDSRRRRNNKPLQAPSSSDEAPSRETPRSRSRADTSRTSSRARLGRTEEARKALEMASAPPGSSDEEVDRRKEKNERRMRRIVVDQVKIMKAVAKESDLATKATLAQVSKSYNKVVKPLLYTSITITSLQQVDKLVSSIESNPHLGELVTSLRITPLDLRSSDTPSSSFIPSLQHLLSFLPNLSTFNEDFTSSEWDVQTLSRDYPFTTSSASPTSLTAFSSKRCWWEIGAINEFFLSQPHLTSIVFGGATMDRDWEGGKLKASLLSSPRSNCAVKSLSIAQIMHEDTLSVLLLLSSNPNFTSLHIGFQSIGPSDDDTPISSIPPALKLVSHTLTHLTLLTPPHPSSSRVSEDTSTLLDDLLPHLPLLESLSFQETLHLTPIPICTSQTLHSLPSTLKVLCARQLFSISTGDVLKLLDSPESIPVLEELDLEWAEAREGEEKWWKERHVERIGEACEEFGIKFDVRKGGRKLMIG